MKIFITGATGLIGTALVKTLLTQNHEISVLTRNIAKAKTKLGDNIKCCTSLNSLDTLDEYDAVINLAGEPIADKRWTAKQKERLGSSRWDITHKLTRLIKASTTPPTVFISGSAVGYYGSQGDKIVTEDTPPHDEYTHQLCKQWEHLALEAHSTHTRVCIVRTGIVLSANGGMLSKLILPFKLGLGTILGKGTQYTSWIHLHDMVGGIVFLLNNKYADGIFNFTSPNPVTNAEFSKALANALHRPLLLRVPACFIKIGLGEVSTLLVDGQRVIPKHLIDAEYKFSYPNINQALENILS